MNRGYFGGMVQKLLSSSTLCLMRQVFLAGFLCHRTPKNVINHTKLSQIQDVIFLSCDIEIYSVFAKVLHIDQLGIKTLDTCDFAVENGHVKISARHIITRSRYENKGRIWFLGESSPEHVRNRDLAAFVRDLSYIEDLGEGVSVYLIIEVLFSNSD